ncbi:galactokinase [Caldimonas tepidiphila]|uniref:galactokinase n=1 Tax=Caldimonas tepidiphila TaxID=2315841 RepID=UPI000E5AB0A8|nr:galactokinase [Caldimonas tepidiphila]
MKSFEDVFGRAPDLTAEAPGRVNLLGEHTDYNDGFVLPTAIPQRTRVSLARSAQPHSTVYAQELDEVSRFTLDAPPPEQFARYVWGCLKVLQARGVEPPPLELHVASDVPMGVGLSSSASLEVAVLRAVRALLGAAVDDVEIAQLAQRAEIEHAGVHCGIMDQMASSLADTSRALFLDTRSLERRLVELPTGCAVLVLDSGITRSLAGSKYNERRSECEQAARALGVASLRDVGDAAAVEGLPEPLRRRARHVVTENARVLRAIEGVSAEEFGRLMNDSHASLRDDYEVSIPPLDELVRLLQQQPGVHGARLTGAGFGGACVALCDAARIDTVAPPVLEAYARAGQRGRVLVGGVGGGQR